MIIITGSAVSDIRTTVCVRCKCQVEVVGTNAPAYHIIITNPFFFDNENSLVGLELAKRTLQEAVILPALRPEVSVVLTSSFHMVLNITLDFFITK